MPAYPMCRKCAVVKHLTTFVESYLEFKHNAENTNLNHVSDHARGYYHGQLALINEMVSELSTLLILIEQERSERLGEVVRV